jgi:hypothetical protein
MMMMKFQSCAPEDQDSIQTDVHTVEDSKNEVRQTTILPTPMLLTRGLLIEWFQNRIHVEKCNRRRCPNRRWHTLVTYVTRTMTPTYGQKRMSLWQAYKRVVSGQWPLRGRGVWLGDDVITEDSHNVVVWLAGNSPPHEGFLDSTFPIQSLWCAETNVGLHVKCPLLSDLNENRKVSTCFSPTPQYEIS